MKETANTKSEIPNTRPGEIPTDLTTLYFRTIGRNVLLTAEEEVKLAQTIEAGRGAYETLVAFGKINPSSQSFIGPSLSTERIEGLQAEFASQELNPADEKSLRDLVARASEARSDFICANLRLVVSIANKFDGKGLERDDLIQEGNIGLMIAVEKFDWTKGFKFSTYATWWIKQAMSRAIADKAGTVRVPVYIHDARKSVERARAGLAMMGISNPTIEQLTEESGLDMELVQIAIDAAVVNASLNHPFWGEDGGGELMEWVPSEDPGPEADAIRTVISEELQHALDGLDELERYIIIRRYGLDRETPATHKLLADKCGITKRRVRQIEMSILTNLRHSSLIRIHD